MQTTPTLACAVDCHNVLGESPIWSPLEQALWWIDVANPTLWRHDPASGALDQWSLPRPPAVIALRRNGGLLLLFRRGYLLLDRPAPGDIIAEPVPFALDADRLNDGKVDQAGRMWVGSLARDLVSPVGQLYRFGTDRALHPVDRGFTLSNGIGWSPMQTTMYFADTHSKTVHAYDFECTSGTLANRREFIRISGHGGPDGLTVDANGNVWVAVFGAGAVHCYRPDGVLARAIELPTAFPTSCTFGGPGLDTLYVTSASMNLDGEAVSGTASTGAVWAVEAVGPGQPESLLDY
ncbi:SMP-30/gluconolactonase/LRE family protein [Paraburkholderia xenovorans]|nr:SMP-30/gluconolactonase/LRE family protein [Paraburkholderia xenovorans]